MRNVPTLVWNKGYFEYKKMKKRKKIVYAYVCGDILHIGHLKYLKAAKKKGDYLIVGVLTDRAVKEKKPIPVIPFKERLETIEAIKYINEVVPQNTYSPFGNIKKIKPDVLVESDSHTEMPANDYVESYGGKVVIIPYYRMQSSTKIKNKIKKQWNND